MSGKTVFYPIGWDDNGLPTERRVQNYFNIACNPNLPYDPDFKPEHIENDKSPRKEVSRKKCGREKNLSAAVSMPGNGDQ